PCIGESVDFVYDGNDQLRRATKKTNGAVVGSEEYWYDGDGARIAIVSRDVNGSKTGTKWFLDDVEAHYDSTNTHVLSYSHLSLGTPVARVRRTVAGAELEYQFHGLGNHTLAAVGSTGATNAAFSYSPFGEVLEAVDTGGSSGTDAHQRRFNDKHQDGISDLAYYGFRYYDKISISWTQSDPLYRYAPDAAYNEPRRAALYTAHLNNPLRYTDPDGRIVQAIIPIVLWVVETAAAAAGTFAMFAVATAAAVAAGLAISAGITGTDVGKRAAIATAIAITGVTITPPPLEPKPSEPESPPKDTGTTVVPLETGGFRWPWQKPSDGVPKPIDDRPGEATDKVEKLPGNPLPKGRLLPPKKKEQPRPLPGGGSGSNQNGHKPADDNADGKVTDDEEAEWMRRQQ
ncbi:MAG: hypothetical protein H0U13_16295, partial [Gemmatimonadaceae bacterium]|nr:hypothetical protein [Gemmatimonadaceae bacterium]